MLLAKRTTVKVDDRTANIVAHTCLSVTKVWNICNYERRNHKELGIDFPNWFTQKKHHKDDKWSRQLPSQSAQEVMKDVDEAWSSFFAVLAGGKVENPHPPGFRHSLSPVVYLQNGFKHEKASSTIRLTISKGLRTFMSETYGIDDTFIYIENRIFNGIRNIKQIQIYPPEDGECVVIVVYEIEDIPLLDDNNRYMSIDIGVHNFLTCYNSTSGETFIMGRKYLSNDRLYYKKIAHKQEIWYAQQRLMGIKYPKSSKAIERLYEKRRNVQNDYLHKMTAAIVKYCEENNIHTVVVGDITGIRKDFDSSDRLNQQMHSLPYKKVIGMLEYKLRLQGILLVRQEESWTSQCSPLSKGVSKRYAKKENRVKRGLYTDQGHTWNADTVGAFNILRKYLKRKKIQITLNPFEIKTPYVFKVAV